MDEMDALRGFRSDQATLDDATRQRIRTKVWYDMNRHDYLAATRNEAQNCLIKMGLLLGVVLMCGYFIYLADTNSMKFSLALVMLACILAIAYYAELNPHREGRVAKAITTPPVPPPQG